MRTIVVPTDFSANALYAAFYAVDFAILTGARIDLLHVYTVPVPVSEVPVPYPVAEVEADARTQLLRLKEMLEKRVAGRIGINIHVRSGDVVTEITSFCDERQPYTIVMGAESASAVERLLFGGKTLGAMKRLAWPLIIVPPHTVFKNIKRIGLACDFRDVIETVRAKEIRELVKTFEAELHILYVSDKESNEFSAQTVEESAWLQEMLGDLEPRYSFLKQPDIDPGIRHYAQTHQIDLLIIIPKKHGLADRLFSRSHSRELVLHAPVPMLAIHQ